jgi:hypothetical protein
MKKNGIFRSVLCNVMSCLYMAGLSSAVYAGAISTKVTTGGPIIDADRHVIPAGSPEESNGDDPRAEIYFTTKIPVSETRQNYSFTANYFIRSAKRTTIAQLLNDNGCTTSGCDRYKPVLSLVAWKQANGTLKICSFENCFASWNNIPESFKMIVRLSGKTASVTINGTTRSFDLINPANGAYRPYGSQQMRYGAYHHDVTGGEANSEAKIRVYNVLTNGF